jgi:alpha-1,3-rhamnosyl/mannosyltransferase
VTVLFDARYPPETGVGRYVLELSRELKQRGRLTYQFLRAPAEAATHDVGIATRPFTIFDQFAVASTLRRYRPQVFHCPHFLIPIFWRGPLVVTIHDVIPLEYPESVASPLARRLYPFLVRLACRRALRILVPSKATADAVIRHGLACAEDIAVTPHGPPRVVETDRSGASGGGDFILYVGDLKPHKNIGTLLRGYSRLPQKLRTLVRLVIVGHGPQGRELREQAYALGLAESVVFLGHPGDRDLSALYAAAELVVLPSLAEGFGMPALEAMVRGIPVIVSDIPALRETTGGAAITFNPHDAEDLKTGLARLLEDQSFRVELGARGRRRAEAFSWTMAARLTEEAYELAMSGKVISKP